jgi:hypothetical protein
MNEDREQDLIGGCEPMVMLPVWVVTRLMSALGHAAGYCDGLGKPCTYLDMELEALEEKVMQALGEKA